MKIKAQLFNETKRCYRLEYKDTAGESASLYLRKVDVDSAGIDPRKGVVITIEEDHK